MSEREDRFGVACGFWLQPLRFLQRVGMLSVSPRCRGKSKFISEPVSPHALAARNS